MLYRTIYKQAQAEQEILRSKFIAYACPIEDRAEGEEFYAQIRNKHKDATHCVPAMVVGEKMEIQWASDDGEPQGSSGPPMLRVLVGENLTNLIVVVVRYFGGTKLGRGGLVRAYSSSAKMGIEAAGIAEVRQVCELTVEIDYGFYEKLDQAQKENNFKIVDRNFAEKITIKVLTPSTNIDMIKCVLDNLTAGEAKVLSTRDKKMKLALDR